MSQPLMTITVDAADLLRAIDALGPAAEAVVRREAKVTAEHVQRNARARARVRSGTMRSAITVAAGAEPLGGYRVFVGPMDDHAMNYRWGNGNRPDNFALWHEMGTRYMSAQPFMFNSAREEEGSHLRRIADGLQEAINAQGLGD